MLGDMGSKDHQVHQGLLDVKDHRELKVKLTKNKMSIQCFIFLYCRVDVVSACLYIT